MSHFQTVYAKEIELWISNYKLRDSKRYRPAYNMTVYAASDRKYVTPRVTNHSCNELYLLQ